MAKLSPASDDAYDKLAEGDLAAVDAHTGLGFTPMGRFSVTITGVFVGTLIVERSYDGGATWVPCGGFGTVVSYTTPISENLTHTGESFVHYRVRMTAFTSGSAHARLSQ